MRLMRQLAKQVKLRRKRERAKKQKPTRRGCKMSSTSKSESDRKSLHACKPNEMLKNSRKRKSNLKKTNVVDRLIN